LEAEIIFYLFFWSAKSLFASMMFFYLIMMPTALLICTENTFWNQDANFVKSFNKSFTLYVESGMRTKVEADIDILGYPSESLAIDEFEEKFCKFIIEHNLRKC
jgi:hypothetical protein